VTENFEKNRCIEYLEEALSLVMLSFAIDPASGTRGHHPKSRTPSLSPRQEAGRQPAFSSWGVFRKNWRAHGARVHPGSSSGKQTGKKSAEFVAEFENNMSVTEAIK
jgi:hypothetical protein